MAQPSGALSHEVQAAKAVAEAERVRWGIVLIAVATLALGCIASMYLEMRTRSVRMAVSNLPMTALLPFVFWLLGNTLLKRFMPRFSLTSAELRLMLCVLWIGGLFVGYNWASQWVGQMAGPRYLASPENRWEELIFDHLPWWMYPINAPRVLEGFYQGLGPDGSVPWGAWSMPLFWSVTTALAITAIGLGLTALFQKHWVQHERLAFPLANISLSLTEGFDRRRGWPPFVRTRAFWMGFAVSAFPVLWNIATYWVPGFPRISIYDHHARRKIHLSRYLSIHALTYRILPTLTAFTFLCNLDILFGIWAPYVVGCAIQYWMNRTGTAVGLSGQQVDYWGAAPIFANGAIAGLVVWAIWTARGHLKRVFRQIAAPGPGEAPETAVLSPRMAVVALAGGLIYMASWLHNVGYDPLVIAFFLLSFCMVLLATMKLLAVSGYAFVHPFWSGLSKTNTMTLLGTTGMSDSSLVGLQVVHPRSLAGWRVPPALPQIARIWGRTKGSVRLICIGLLVGLLTSALSTIWLCYADGGANLDYWNTEGAARNVYNRAAGMLVETERTVFDPYKMGIWLTGGLLVVLFGVLQTRVLWWPAHPLGLMLFGMPYLQFYMLNVFLVWVAKLAVLRLGGIELYRRVLPCCYGLIVGYVFAVGCSCLVDVIWFPERGHHVYSW